MAERTEYSSRSAAIRAAKAHCRRALGPAFEASEGPDFEIHPKPIRWNYNTGHFHQPCTYSIRNPEVAE